MVGRVLRFFVMAFVWFCVVSVGLVLLYKFVPPPVTATMILDENGIDKNWTSLSHIDRNMVDAAIAAEDGKFCEHNGFDREAIEKAIKRNSPRRAHPRRLDDQPADRQERVPVQGGGYFRKGLEAWFTLLIENIWGKRRIMEVYLNVAETGIGTYGVEAGAERYYRHSADRLTSYEAARIAAVLPLPKKRDAVDPGGFTRRYGNTIARAGRLGSA